MKKTLMNPPTHKCPPGSYPKGSIPKRQAPILKKLMQNNPKYSSSSTDSDSDGM